MRKLLAIATAAAILAACGEIQRSNDDAAGTAPDLRETEDTGEANAPADRRVARAVETEPGEWRYKKSNGYPWAGFGPPASEAVFTISCQKGQVVFGHAVDLDGGQADMVLKADGETAPVKLIDVEGALPMAEGALPANSVFIDTLLNTDSAFTVEVEGGKFSLRPAPEYRQVIRECRAGAG